jgi:hypothetical protein
LASILQDPEKLARALPQPLGLGLPEEMSDGMLPREKNQMLIALLVHSVA